MSTLDYESNDYAERETSYIAACYKPLVIVFSEWAIILGLTLGGGGGGEGGGNDCH